MILYYGEISPPSRAVYAVVKTLGIPVQVKKINMFKGENRSEDYLKVNPAHQVPALVEDGFVMTESRAIMAYLINQFAPGHDLYPADPRTRAQIDRFLYFEASNLYPAIKGTYSPKLRKLEPTEDQMKAARNAVNELLAMKGNNKFLAGNCVSLADVSLAMNYDFMKEFFPEGAKPLATWYCEVEKAVPAVKEINDQVDLAPLVALTKKC